MAGHPEGGNDLLNHGRVELCAVGLNIHNDVSRDRFNRLGDAIRTATVDALGQQDFTTGGRDNVCDAMITCGDIHGIEHAQGEQTTPYMKHKRFPANRAQDFPWKPLRPHACRNDCDGSHGHNS